MGFGGVVDRRGTEPERDLLRFVFSFSVCGWILRDVMRIRRILSP